jgi:tRNA(Ile)-lysidine synthase
MAHEPQGSILQQIEAALAACGLLAGRLTVGLSGGVDSVALLDALVELRARHSISLSAVHVDHGISPHAAAWRARCASLCTALDVPLTAVAVVVSRASGEGLEAAARAARYAVFRAQNADAVVLAHHADDQAETVLLQLLRGSGVAGLAAMPLERVLDAHTGLRLVRPLLHCSRAQIEAHARARALAWVEDESNRDPTLERNFLRHTVLPLLAQRYPACCDTLGRVAENLGDAQRLLEALAAQDAGRPALDGRLDLRALRGLDSARRRNLLRWFLRANGLIAPGRERLEDALRQLLGARADAQPSIELGRACLRRHRGWLQLEAARPPAPPWTLTWGGEHELALPDGSRLRFFDAQGEGLSRARLAEGVVTVRTRSGGERLRPAAERPTRTLKNLLQEAGVPAWRRASLPLLFVGDTLAWVAGIGHDCRFGAKPAEAGVLIEWSEPGLLPPTE